MARRRRFDWPIVVASWLLLAAAPDPDAAFVEAWTALPAHADWRLLVSPPFPAEWPQHRGRNAVIRYAYAMRASPGVVDGVEIAAPWASATTTPEGRVIVLRLTDRLQPLGRQGVRPLTRDEQATIARAQEVTDGLIDGIGPDRAPLVRAYVCGWFARQGLVADTIRPRHVRYVDWLACG